MGRPAVTAQRREEILNAFEICVARYGVEGATLEKVAEQAGLARALIRHHLGNREVLIDALVDRFVEQSHKGAQEYFEQLDKEGNVSELINSMFDPQYVDPHQIRVTAALITAVADRPVIAEPLRDWVDQFIIGVKAALAKEAPGCDERQLQAVATGISSIYFNADSLSPLGAWSDLRDDSKQAAILLVQALGINVDA